MSSFQEFQRTKEKEQQTKSKEEKNIVVFMIGSLFFFPLVLLMTVFFGAVHDKTNSCEEVGGTYVVIGEEFSASLKQNIDIYGCVKK